MSPLSPTGRTKATPEANATATSKTVIPSRPTIPPTTTASAASSASMPQIQQGVPQAPKPRPTGGRGITGRGASTRGRGKLRGRGRPLGGSLSHNQNSASAGLTAKGSVGSMTALLAAAESISDLHGDGRVVGGTAAAGAAAVGTTSATNSASAAASNPANNNNNNTNEFWNHPALKDDTSLDSEYAKFVRGLVDDDQSLFTFRTLQSLPMPTTEVPTIVGDDMKIEEDDEDYQLTSEEEDDDDKKEEVSVSLEEFDLDNVFGEIEGLLEEDLDQLTSLFDRPAETKIPIMGTEQQKAITSPGQSTKKKKSTQTVVTSPPVAPVGSTATVTKRQLTRLSQTMAHHHQLLLQQATLSVRAAYVQKASKETRPRPTGLPASMLNSRSLTFCAPKGRECRYENDFMGGEGAEELAECLDGAVGMLQDLEQNWKDAVRNSIQLSFQQNPTQLGGRRKLLPAISEEAEPEEEQQESNHSSERRLTRSAFTKTLLEREMGEHKDVRHRGSVFDIRGLARLRETFLAIDNSVKEVRMEERMEGDGGINILYPVNHGEACEMLLKHAGAEVNEALVPGIRDLGDLLTHAPEAFSEPEKVNSTLTKTQRIELRRNKSQFTAGEDNLILRGVNLYGEKEWVLVSDRFLPDRAVNGISQRYHRLCFLIYKSNGVFIDDDGKLAPLPAFKKTPTDDEAIEKTQEAVRKIKPPAPPTTMNVHRWTIEEDIAILKAVPMMGNQWAEICNHLMPHRDRGHIRKRYQVLERRIPKGTTKMNLKRPASELNKEIAKYAKTGNASKPTKTAAPPKKPAPKKSNSSASKPRTKTPKAPAAAPAEKPAHVEPKVSPPPSSSIQPFPAETSSFDVIDEDHEKAAALLHRLSSPQRPRREEQRSLSQEHNAAKDLEYILNGSDHSNAGEGSTRMGLERILADDWSQESGMQRLLDAGLAEDSKTFHSPLKANHLPEMAVEDANSRLSLLNELNAVGDSSQETSSKPGARRSLLSSAIEKTKENASKRKNTEAPWGRSVKVSGSPVKVNLGSYVSSSPVQSPTQSPTQENIFSEPLSLAAAYEHLTPRVFGTPNKVDRHNPVLEEGERTQLNDEAFQYFMSGGTPTKNMTPSRLLPPNTPLNQLGYTYSNAGGLSGPFEAGNNSLFMAGDDFDCVSALQDLSNSAPPTPSRLLLPARIGHRGSEGEREPERTTEEIPKPKTSFLSKVKAQVGATQRKAA